MARRLPTVQINGKTYLIDSRRLELRNVKNRRDVKRLVDSFDFRVEVEQALQSSIDPLVEQALDSFWQVIVKAYPHATSGDLSPLPTIRLDEAARVAIAEWIVNNAL